MAGLRRLLSVMKEDGDLAGDNVPEKYVISASDGGLTTVGKQ